MLPQEHIKWLVAQPEIVRMDRQAIEYFPLSTDARTVLSAVHKIIIEGLNKNLDVLQPELYDGMQYAIDKTLGTDSTEWHENPLVETISKVIDRTVTRIIFGTPLSRNESFLKALRGSMIGAAVLTEFMGQLPYGIVRRLAAVPISLFIRVFQKMSIAYLRPRIKELMLKIEDENAGKSQPGDSFDFVAQSIRSVRKLKHPIEINKETFVAEILTTLSFSAIMSNSAVTTNAFLDILGPGTKHDIYATLRTEAETVMVSESDWKDPSSLRKLTNIDSTLRESARMSPVQTRGLLKQVMPKEGLDLPDGTYVSQGTWLGIPIESIHRDGTIYPDALQFDPLRFARLTANDSTKNLDITQASDTYLFFSYGRSMCPGRWFATRVMKLVVAYIAFHYDIKPLTEHSERFSVGDTKLHHTSVKMSVRRRKLDNQGHE